MKKSLIVLACLFTVTMLSAQVATSNKTDDKGLKQGAWEEKTGTGISKGKYLNDLKEGTWITYSPNGNVNKIEEFEKGKREGIYVEIDQRGYLAAEMYYHQDLLEGVAKKFYYGTNPASIIEYKQGKINGKKKIYYENAAGKLTEESDYVNDVKDGPSNFFSANGDPIAEYIYKNGLLEGVQKMYYPGKKLMSEQNYERNVESGSYKEYYEDGKLMTEGIYKNGKMEDKWIEYHQNGVIKAEGMYLNGEKEGKWTEFDENGKAVKTVKYLKGVEKP